MRHTWQHFNTWHIAISLIATLISRGFLVPCHKVCFSLLQCPKAWHWQSSNQIQSLGLSSKSKLTLRLCLDVAKYFSVCMWAKYISLFWLIPYLSWFPSETKGYFPEEHWRAPRDSLCRSWQDAQGDKMIKLSFCLNVINSTVDPVHPWRPSTTLWLLDWAFRIASHTWLQFRTSPWKNSGLGWNPLTTRMMGRTDVGGAKSLHFLWGGKCFNVLKALLSFLFYIPIPAVYPSNQQFQAHFGEFLQHGYRSGMGSVETKFDHGFGTREIATFSVKFVDGQTKVLIMLSIVAYCVELEFGEQELNDPMLAKVLDSFRSIKCSFEFYENAAHHFLHSLRFLLKIISCCFLFPLCCDKEGSHPI